MIDMQVLEKDKDSIWYVLATDEVVRIGDIVRVENIISQVVDLSFADLPGVLEHILRKSLIPKAFVKEQMQPEVKSILDTLADQKLALAKIRGTVEEHGGREKFSTGVREFTVRRSKAVPEVVKLKAVLEMLGIDSAENSDLAVALSTEPSKFGISKDRIGINLITGMKGSGKSYFSKRLLLKLIEAGVVTVVFDLNGEYLNLWKDPKTGKPNEYAGFLRTFTPKLSMARGNEAPLSVPLNEISYSDFADYVSLDRQTQMYNELIAFWEDRAKKGERFDLNDLKNHVGTIANEYVRNGLLGKIRAAEAYNLFGPSTFAESIKSMKAKGGGAIIINLVGLRSLEREIVVDFVLRRVNRLCDSREVSSISLFLEEAQLYVTKEKFVDLLTRMRHIGVFPTFITNDPTTMPEELYSLGDNFIVFPFKNEDTLRHLSKAGMVDMETLEVVKHLKQRQCIMVGRLTENFPVFLEILPQAGVEMGGETRRLV